MQPVVYVWCIQLPEREDKYNPVFSSECLNLAVMLIERLDGLER